MSFIIFFARIWDGFSDPFVGYLVSKTRLKWGRLRAWCVIGACRHTGTHTRRRTCFSLPVCLLGYFAFWMVPKGLCMSRRRPMRAVIRPQRRACRWRTTSLPLLCTRQDMRCVPYLPARASSLRQAYLVPYTSLTMHLSDEPSERDSGTTVRMLFDIFSALFSSVFQGTHAVALGRRASTAAGWVLVNLAEKGDSSNCPVCGNTTKNVTDPVYDSGKEKGFIISAVVIIVLAAAGGYTCFFFVKERMGVHVLSIARR